MIAFPIAMVISLSAIDAPSQRVQLLPVDEASKDSTFFAFRRELLRLVQKRDQKGLMKFIQEDTKISFGGSIGPKDFIEWWHPEDRESKLWMELQIILLMGGAFNADGEFEAPYISARWPEQFDAFEYSAITAKNVRCYPVPDQKRKPVRILSFDIVRTSVDDSNFAESQRLEQLGWCQIELLDGTIGYVRSNQVRSGVDQRIYFSKDSHGNWFISAFIAGD